MQELLAPEQHELLREVGRLAQSRGMSVYLVGGPVRDLLLGRQQLDLDVAVEGDGPQFAQACAQMLGAAVTVHEAFMTAVLALPGGRRIDIATARRETYEHPGALPTVEPAPLAEDLARRDFTINALAVGLNPEQWGQLHDPFDGRGDLQAGLIRVLHDQSFMDDPTRLIRAVGFAVRLGFSLAEHTGTLAQAAIGRSALDLLSAQRRGEVLLPLLRGEFAAAVLVRMGELGMLKAMGLGRSLSDDVQMWLAEVPAALKALGSPQTGQPAALAYLALVAADAGTEAETLGGYLQAAAQDRCALKTALRMLGSPPPELSTPDVSPADLYFALEQADLVTAAALWARSGATVRERIEHYWLNLRHIEADVSGDDLLAAGARPGPDFSVALAQALRVKLNDPAAGRQEQLEAAVGVLSRASESTECESQ